MEDIQLRRALFEDLCKAKFLDCAFAGIAGRLEGNMGWDRRDNLSFIVRCLWRLDRKETFGFIVTRGDRRAQAQVNLEQRRLGLFGWHFGSAGVPDVEL